MSSAPSTGMPFPPGSLNFNGFSFFNAISFQIVLGAPVILYAKSLGATSLVLGTIAALTPLLTILQLVAARFCTGPDTAGSCWQGGGRERFPGVVVAVPLFRAFRPGFASAFSWRRCSASTC